MCISVVIPVYEDPGPLEFLLEQLSGTSVDEVVVVEAGHENESAIIAERAGARWIRSAPGRGIQMNRGAQTSRGNILWFLHADTILLPQSDRAIRQAMTDPAIQGGAFAFRLNHRHWFAPIMDVAENLRTRLLDLPYGDQAFFVRRCAFEASGGFSEIPIMEDVEFIERFRKDHRCLWLDTPVGINARRWEREGFVKITMRNLGLLAAYRLGVSPDVLRSYYRPSSMLEESVLLEDRVGRGS